MWKDIIECASIVVSVCSAIFFLYKKYKELRKKYFYCGYIHSAEGINKKIAALDFMTFEKTDNIDGTWLRDWYLNDMREMRIRDEKGQCRIKIPYKELVNFIENPDTKITISEPVITKEFELIPGLKEATDYIENEVRKKKPGTTNDYHPSMSSFEPDGKGNYTCTFEKTCYFKQIRTNLSLDRPIYMPDSCETTLRKIGLKGITKDQRLPSLSKSCLANVVGVSAIWCMGSDGNRQYYLLPRKGSVGVYEKKLGIPSGDADCPSHDEFQSDSLVDFLKAEMLREFAEETGIADVDMKQYVYSHPVDVTKIGLYTKVEIIPLAFLREMLRGGKPQMFFLIRTEEIPYETLHRCFRLSQGRREFNSRSFTDATLSTEVACNYLYAKAYLQQSHRNGGVIDVSRT